MLTDIDVILFDFGGTLGEEVASLFLDDAPAAWHKIWIARFAEPGFGERWERGDIRAEALIEDLAYRFGADADSIRAHIQRRCQSVAFNPGIMKYVRARRRRGLPQALVTVNPDLFALIAEHYALQDLFDTVVLSAHEGTIDKVELCRIALDRLGGKPLASALLIDNTPAQVRAFENAGGYGYRFIDDATVLADLASGQLPSSLAS